MTYGEIVAVLKHITYKPEFDFRIEPGQYGAVKFTVTARVPDSDRSGNQISIFSTFEFHPREIRDKSGILRIVEVQLRDLENHELYEWFRYDGKHIHAPHRRNNGV